MSKIVSSSRLSVLAILSSLSGCAGDSRPALHEEYTGSSFWRQKAVLSSMSTDAAYRSAYILLGNGTLRGVDSSGRKIERYTGQFCPEPPPDVAQSISAAITAALEAEIKPPAGQVGGTVGANFGEALATGVTPLIDKSQGLQFFRDRMFYTCVAYLNGALSEREYAKSLSDNADLAAVLIAIHELKSSDQKQNDLKSLEIKFDEALDMIERLKNSLGTTVKVGSGS